MTFTPTDLTLVTPDEPIALQFDFEADPPWMSIGLEIEADAAGDRIVAQLALGSLEGLVQHEARNRGYRIKQFGEPTQVQRPDTVLGAESSELMFVMKATLERA